jgi:hypothetical protein
MIPFLAIAILLAGAASGQSAVPTSASSPDISALQKSAEAGDAQAEFALAQASDFGKGLAQK